MKRIISIALVAVLCTVGAFAGSKKPIPYKELPKTVQKEFKKGFPEEQVQIVTSERLFFKSYEYTLLTVDGTKVVYNEKGEVKSVKNDQGVNEAFVPKEIVKYVKKNLPNSTITEYERGALKQEVELNGKMEIVFNKNGKFLRIED